MKCTNCNWTVPDDARFCSNCGQALTLASIHAEQARGGFNLDRYLPRELALKFEAIRANNSLGGERRIITMLFCDVKGSTAAAEQLDPEEWTEIMNGAFEHMIRPIYKYEGLVPRLMGDAILAFFGAPIAHEDDPRRAVLAGLEIQSGIQPYVEEIHARYGVRFALRVGINTGLVVVGEIGSDLRMEYTAIGDAINLAARMEQTAAPGSVQISEETYKLVVPFFEFEPLGGIEVKGKAAPVNAYRALSTKETPGQSRGLQGLSSPLVGREAELSVLEECSQSLQKGRGAIAVILGEAGLGKSSLVAAFHERLKSISISWLEAHALSYAQSISYFSWRQILRQSIGAQELETPTTVRAKLHYACERYPLPEGDIPFLEGILAVEGEKSLERIMSYQGEALLRRMAEAADHYLRAAARDTPLVIVFDDLHWMDEASLTLLSNVIELVENNPVLFICMMRPEADTPSWVFNQRLKRDLASCFRQIELLPFSREKTDNLLANLLGPGALPEALRDLILEKAEGNPFFVEEIIRSLMETGQILRQAGGWQAVERVTKVSLPNTLSGLLSARIDRLPDSTKQILHFASVIGRSFDLRILSSMAVPAPALGSHIDRLQHAGLIQAVLNGTDTEFMFRHALIHEAAYASILLKQRRELHTRVGAILEAMYSDRLHEFAPLLAHHFYTAQDPRSLEYDILAGENAARLYANAEAATHFSHALETARRIHASHVQIDDLYKKLGQSFELSGHHEQALETYHDMERYARDYDLPHMQLAALLAKATLYSTYTHLHSPALGEQTLLQALELSNEIGDRAVQAKLNWNLMLTYLFSKRLDRALEYGERALTLARASEDREQLAFVLNDLCRLYTCRGDFEKALQAISEGRELWQILNNQTMLADSYGSEAEARFQSGEYQQALELLNEGLLLNAKIENLWGMAYNRMLISFIAFDRGEIGRAIQLSIEAIAEGERGGLVAISTGHRAELGWFYGYYGDIEKGLELTRQALEVANAKQPDFKALPQALQARLYLLSGDLDSAERTAGPAPLEPITIPYARYTIFVCLANVELALARTDYALALNLAKDLLAQVSPLTIVDVPEVLRRKADALVGLERFEEARQTLSAARSHAERFGSRHHLWSVLSSLAEVHAKLGQQEEAEACRKEAREIVEWIAEGLQEVGLRESFVNQPRVRALRH
ncbi:MAG TPA: adenylate/guanylate cyclase domain-containing protein [Anaerolineales bacterium]|nr:adenylate/guanylate cyclase domain-containing protein [Anaerolineales bacterium]